MDGGIRRGADGVKAFALGASAGCGRPPVLWELAAGGEDGVRQMLEMLRSELARLSRCVDAACQWTLAETSYSFASGGTALAIVIVSRSQLPLPPLRTGCSHWSFACACKSSLRLMAKKESKFPVS
jgi:hypothetical protein